MPTTLGGTRPGFKALKNSNPAPSCSCFLSRFAMGLSHLPKMLCDDFLYFSRNWWRGWSTQTGRDAPFVSKKNEGNDHDDAVDRGKPVVVNIDVTRSFAAVVDALPHIMSFREHASSGLRRLWRIACA